jgi:hypothetical protein
MTKYVNTMNTSLPVALWLATDNYDYQNNPMAISTTTVIKPVRQIILGMQAVSNGMEAVAEVSSMVASRMGTSFHDSIESAWMNNYKKGLAALGYPQKAIDLVRINPDSVEGEEIPIYLERRSSKEVGPYTISGKFDMVMEGHVRDFKSTSTYSYEKGINNKKYILQGSVYRWLNQEIINQDVMYIDFIFTDWSVNKAKSGAKNGYPPTRVLEYPLKLMSVEETQSYLDNKIAQIIRLKDAPQSEIPLCDAEDLWQSDAVWKYFKNPASAGEPGKRSTKNFNNPTEANTRLIEDGCVGVVVEVKGEVKACNYCKAINICEQAADLRARGLLK